VNPHTPNPSQSTVLVVAGGKGGTGTSLVAALLALAVAGEGRRVLLVDAVAGVPALARLVGAVPGAEPVPVGDTLALLAPAAAADADARANLLARAAAGRDGHDLVVVDAGARLEAVLAACDTGVSRLALVTTEDRVALAATHALLKAVDARLPALPADVVVNRAGEREALAVHDHLATAAERFLGRPLGLAGAVPDDPCLPGGLGAGMTVQDAAAGSPAALAARAAGLRLLDDRTTLPPRERAADPAPPERGAPRSHARHA
jgi:MinD-like ATPase involved in chromosome partitioning or flagellar assembly